MEKLCKSDGSHCLIFIILGFSALFLLNLCGFLRQLFWAISYVLLTLLIGFLTWLFSYVLK